MRPCDPRRPQRPRAARLPRPGAAPHRSRDGRRAGIRGRLLRALVARRHRPTFPRAAPYALPLDEPIDHDEAWAAVDGMLGALEGLDLTVVTRVSEILPGQVNAIVHFEGAEPIAPDLSDLDDWVARGLRSVGITWSRANAFARRGAVPLPLDARHRAGPDRGRARPPARLQLPRASGRRLAPERGRVLGRRPCVAGADRRDAFERACALAVVAEPHRPPARRDRGVGRRRRRQLRGHVPHRGWETGTWGSTRS